jgi:hypothetical protein
VHPGEQVADRRRVGERRGLDAAPGQPRHQRGRTARERRPQRAAAIGDRVGAGHAARGQVAHQVEVEGQPLGREPLEERQHPAPGVGVDEEVAVLDALGDAAVVAQRPDRIAGQPAFELVARDGGEDGHGGRERDVGEGAGRAGAGILAAAPGTPGQRPRARAGRRAGAAHRYRLVSRSCVVA